MLCFLWKMHYRCFVTLKIVQHQHQPEENPTRLLAEAALRPDGSTAPVIAEILDLRHALDLPTDEHTVEFLMRSTRDEVEEILAGVQELARIYSVSGRRTFATAAATV